MREAAGIILNSYYVIVRKERADAEQNQKSTTRALQ